jgi:hypothetical protein
LVAKAIMHNFFPGFNHNTYPLCLSHHVLLIIQEWRSYVQLNFDWMRASA